MKTVKTDANAAAMTAYVAAHPGDAAAAAALTDALIDAGTKPQTARRHVAELVGRRTAELAWEKDSKVRTRVRGRVYVPPSVPVHVVGGRDRDDPPRVTGVAPYHTFKTGGVCHHPGAAIRNGFKVRYHADTRSVTVGWRWLLNNAVAKKK